jgi:hypothetical protein
VKTFMLRVTFADGSVSSSRITDVDYDHAIAAVEEVFHGERYVSFSLERVGKLPEEEVSK